MNNTTDLEADWVVIQKVNTVHSNPTLWQTDFVFTTSDTNKPAWEYNYDIQITYADWKKSSSSIWICTILQDATKS